MDDVLSRLRRLAGDRPLPLALLDLDAVDRNARAIAARARRANKTLRIATKSLRVVGLARHLLATAPDVCRGLLAFTAREALSLHGEGFDDLLVAYPSVVPADLAALADLAERGATAAIVVDDPRHVQALSAAARGRGVTLHAVVDVDMSYRAAAGRVHLGVERSPVRDAAQAVALAARVADAPGLSLDGFMGYEAQIAGLGDASPFAPALNLPKRAIRAISRPFVRRLRAEIVERARARGLAWRLFNGGGSGSLDSSCDDPSLTEVTAGSGFVDSHLFDHFSNISFEPALFFALAVARAPRPGVVTCAGGGYVASGAAGPDRLPLPWAPRGLRLLPMEGAGEVQTPVAGDAARALAPGDPVFFRHAKAGELAERFERYAVARGDVVVDEWPTYRGQGWCLL
ncbi:MAG: alanine racemase [Polyangiaceae bacterium]|nr:alanine racemase [Polyangiaceae bacterium]